jgi:hypothetical protein
VKSLLRAVRRGTSRHGVKNTHLGPVAQRSA